MFPPSQTDRTDEKLAAILNQIGAVGGRFNRLAFQYWIFTTLALLVGIAALTVVAAFLLSPPYFFIVGVLLVASLGFGLVETLRAAWRMRATPERAASLADERAQLKGRLMTLVAMAMGKATRSSLWPYLVEDTVGLREEFAPARIEPRWISRSIFKFLAACVLAALVAPFAVLSRAGRLVGTASPPDITVDIGNLHLRPADPALGPGVELNADPATLRKLAEKMTEEERSGEGANPLAKLMNRARHLADNLQDELTGSPHNRQPRRMTVTDKNSGSEGNNRENQRKADGNAGASERSDNQSTSNGKLPQLSGLSPKSQREQSAANAPSLQNPFGDLTKGIPEYNPRRDTLAGDQNGNAGEGGASHGSGTDPDNLLGPLEVPPVGDEGLKIAIDAQLSDSGQSPGSPAYLPPKVHASLNSHQYPDEPLARTSVPADDRMTVKRVFER
jgi:hypothetical protein